MHKNNLLFGVISRPKNAGCNDNFRLKRHGSHKGKNNNKTSLFRHRIIFIGISLILFRESLHFNESCETSNFYEERRKNADSVTTEELFESGILRAEVV